MVLINKISQGRTRAKNGKAVLSRQRFLDPVFAVNHIKARQNGDDDAKGCKTIWEISEYDEPDNG